MDDLKQALFTSPVLRPINYKSYAPVILSVNTSYIAVGYILPQDNLEKPCLQYHSWFGSIMLNEWECCFSQLKLELYGLYCVLRALKLHLISIRNLVIKVDAKYIKGMLTHPDITPSASINCWILAILMFHFMLVYIPGVQHSPDGLSRRQPQPGDEEEPEDDFNNWIDNVNGFIHFINPLPSYNATLQQPITTSPPITIYMGWDEQEESVEPDEEEQQEQQEMTQPYSIIPRTEQVNKADKCLIKVQQWWLETLIRPNEMTDAEYKTFMRYCTEFFIFKKHLWHKDTKGQHKMVIAQEQRLFLMASAHNDIGHHSFYVMNALLMEWYWWPFMAQDIN